MNLRRRSMPNLVQKRALVLLRPARLACRNLRLPSLLTPFALFFFPSGRKALGTSARPGEIALVLKEQIEQLFRRARWPGRAIELQSFGAGNRVFETKAEKPHEREAVAKTVFRPIAGTSACNASALKTASPNACVPPNFCAPLSAWAGRIPIAPSPRSPPADRLFRRGFHSAGSKRKKRCPTPNSRVQIMRT